jgi:hypothetical protein
MTEQSAGLPEKAPSLRQSEQDEIIRNIEERNAKTFDEAEKHLELKPGTLGDNTTESDFVAVVKIAGTIEPLLNEALETECKLLRKHKIESVSATALTRFVQQERNRQKKADLAHDMGLIAEGTCDFVKALFDIRDHYAHHVRNLHLSVFEVAEKASTKNKKIFMHVAGIDMASPNWKIVSALFIRGLIFHRFAMFLSTALNVIKPPPLPRGLGLLGSHDWTSGTETPLTLATEASRQDTPKTKDRNEQASELRPVKKKWRRRNVERA